MTQTIDLSNSAVLGAAGKMGRGIALLLSQHLTDQLLFGDKEYHIQCIDNNAKALLSLRAYLRSNLQRHAEKNIVPLRQVVCSKYSLTSNEEVVDFYAATALDRLFCATSPLAAVESSVIFEALPEIPALKVETFLAIGKVARHPQLILSNTSSIPISLLSEASHLQGQIAGFHFYNPPPLQKLVELVFPDSLAPEKQDVLKNLASALGKTAVVARDIPGFIGNGFFMREIAFNITIAERFAAMIDLPSALWAIDQISREWLIKPMGIFQLIDYVGVDVCINILKVMSEFLGDRNLQAPLLSRLLEQGRRGGQDQKGHAKEGIFQYDAEGHPKAVWNSNTMQYQNCDHSPVARRITDALGKLPEGHHSWKELQQRKDKVEILKRYLENLCQSNEMGAMLAVEMLRFEHATALLLSESKVAQNAEDVNTVLKLGFHRLYGPAESWLPPMITTAHLEELKS